MSPKLDEFLADLEIWAPRISHPHVAAHGGRVGAFIYLFDNTSYLILVA